MKLPSPNRTSVLHFLLVHSLHKKKLFQRNPQSMQTNKSVSLKTSCIGYSPEACKIGLVC